MEAKKVLDKVLSGRFLLTIVAAIILLKLVFSPMGDQVLSKVIDLVELIVVFYFLRNDRTTNGGSNEKIDS